MTRPPVTALVALLLIGSLSLAGCGQNNSGGQTTEQVTDATAAPTEVTASQRTFTLTELAQFDGKDGNLAYVAVDGIVYDVSASLSWPEGVHTRCDLGAMAGRDLSELIKQAPPNMRSLLERMPVVGSLE